MVDIDERVVSMKFNSNDFEKKSKSTLDTLDKLNDKLSFKDAANSDSLNAIADNVQKVADKAYTIVDRMIDKIKDNIANKLVNFLQQNTVGQLQAGWSKYADMTTSVATLKSQGYEMEKITEQLERLNYFTDETSFEFTKMVGEIGKFTASGQKLEDATTAMMGIANWAALSGKNAGEASRAMYQLSQALGAGQMRLQDYKSVQNLNMDTKEFRENAIEAAIAVGTLKDNLNGTYTSALNNKITFSLQNFSESLTQGKWFNTDVMMSVYKKYSEAVDEIREIYEEGSYMDAQGNYVSLNTTAEAVNEVKKNNEYLVSKFKKTELNDDQINKLLSKWKKVEKVTDVTVKEYAEMNDLTEEQAKMQMKAKQEGYAEYLKEYAETFQDAEKSAVDALEDWHTYVSSYGIKAFSAAQEAKTFGEAIESAKDAASTVWTTIYTNIFGNYDEARSLWTDLANSLYEIFVNRLWDLNDVFEYWRSGGSSALESLLDKYQKELKSLESKSSPVQAEIDRMRFLRQEIDRLDTEINTVFLNGEKTTTYAVEDQIAKYENELNAITAKTDLTKADKKRIEELKKELETLNEALENTIFVDGRTRMFQGIYAFGAGFKSLLFNLREGWDQVTEDNIGGKRLLSFSEKLRNDGLRFYRLMENLGKTSFFRNISQGIKNLFSPITTLIKVVGSVIGQFLPQSKTVQDALNSIALRFKELTDKIRPSEETIKRLARILRGVVSFFRLIGKAVLGIWNNIIKPIFDTLFGAGNSIFGTILELLASIADAFFGWEKGVDQVQAMATVGEVLKTILQVILSVVINLVGVLRRFLGPVISFIANTIGDLINKLKGLFSGNGGNVLKNVADGFKNIGDRAKKAWNSTETLADVFNRFKGGSGIGNFLKMLGAMLDNIITKIGSTIGALLGFDEAATSGKVGHAINSLKDVFYEVGTIIRWLYTNVIRPTLFALFESVAACMTDIGEAFKTGDILHILEVIGKSIKTIGALELFKVLRAITKIIGSGGLLKVFRNTAKTIKQIGTYFKAQTMNAISTSLLKFAIAAGLVLGVLTAISFLPTQNLETLKNMLIGVAIALGVFLTVLTLMTKFNHGAENIWDFFKADPLESAARMLFGLTAAIITTIGAIMLLRLAFNNLFDDVVDENGKKTGEKKLNIERLFSTILGTLAPILTIVSALWLIGKVLKKSGIVKHLAAVAAALVGIGASIMFLAIAVKTLTGVFASDKNSAGQIWSAFGMLIALITVMTIVTIVMSRFLATSGNLKSGLAVAAGVVAMIAATVFIVMPMLDDLIQNVDKFPQYMQAILIVVTTILGIGASFYLLTSGANGKGGSLKILAAGLVFSNIVHVIKNFMIPMLQEISKIDNTSLLSSAASLGLLSLLIGIAIERILKGLSSLMGELRRINAKTWLTIILSMGAVIASIVVLSHIFEDQGKELSVGSVLLVLGTFLAIMVGFGLFAKMIVKTTKDDATARNDLVRLVNSLSIFIGVLTASFVGMLAAIKYMYEGNIGDALTVIGTMAITILGVLALSMFILSKAIKSISNSFRTAYMTNIDSILSVIAATFISIGGLIVLLTSSAIFIRLAYNDTLGYIGTISTVVIGTLLLIGGVFAALTIFFTKVATSSYNENTFNILKITFISLLVLVGEIALAAIYMQSIFGKENNGYIGMIATLVGSTLAAVGLVLLFISKFIKSIGNIKLNERQFATILSSLFLITVILGEVGLVLIPSLARLENVSWDVIASTLLGIAAIIGIMMHTMAEVQKAGVSHHGGIKGLVASIIGLAANLLLLAFVVPKIFEAFNLLRGTELTEILGGLAAIIVPFYVLTTTIKAFATAKVGHDFMMTSLEIAAGLAVMAAAFAAVAVAASMLKDVFGLGETTFSIFNQGWKKESKTKSPSKVMAQNGKYLAQGLGLGIKQSKSLITKTAVGMADLTNDSFCDELGIASPSKVFYENGRFVVRGFINGMGDETNKNKSAGADMAEGFTEGMDDAIKKMQDGMSGIWDNLNIDEEAEKAGEGLFDSFFSQFLGDDEGLTEEEQKKLTNFEKDVDDELAKWEKEHKSEKGTREYEENKAKQKNAIRNRMLEQNEEIRKLIEKQNKTGNNSSFASTLSGIFSGGLSDAFDNPDLKEKIDSGLSDIGGKITGFFGIDGDFASTLGNLFNGDGGIVDETISNAGDKIIELTGGENGAAANALKLLSGDKKITSAAENLGSTVGSSIMTAIYNELSDGPIYDLLVNLSGIENYGQNMNRFNNWYEKNVNDLFGDNTEKADYFKHLVAGAIAEFGSEGSLYEENFMKYAQSYNTTDWKNIKEFSISKGWLWFGEGIGKFTENMDESARKYTKYAADATVQITELDEELSDILRTTNINGLSEGVMSISTSDDIATILKDLTGNGIINQYELFKAFQLALLHDSSLYKETGAESVDGVPLGKIELTRKGNYVLRELLNASQQGSGKQVKANTDYINNILKKYLTANENEYEKLDNFQETYSEITGDHNEYTEEELREIYKEAKRLGLLNENTGKLLDITETGFANLGVGGVIGYEEQLRSLTEFANGKIHARPDGSLPVTIVGDETGKTQKTIYDFAKTIANSGGINYLNKLNNAARGNDASAQQELSRITNGLGYSKFMTTVETRYNALQSFMKNATDNDYLNGNYNKWFDEAKFYEKYYNLGKNNAQGETNGYTDTLDANKGKKTKSEEKTIEDSKTTFDQASPSEIYYAIGMYNALGLQNGFLDYMDIFDKASVNTIQGINKDAAIAFEAMVDSLDDDNIHPTITPVFDADAIQNGVKGVNVALNNFTPTAQATLNSFKDDTPNYNSSFADLSNKVATLTTVVNSFMQMVAEGDIIDININTEADTNNIYETVVNMNRQKFRQTGKNPLAY